MRHESFALYHKRCMEVHYTSREGGDWHVARISPYQYLRSLETHRFGALTVCAMRVAHSCLIYDHILAAFHPTISPWRIQACPTNVPDILGISTEHLSLTASKEYGACVRKPHLSVSPLLCGRPGP